MRRATQLVAVVAVVVLSLGVAAGRDEERTLKGSYHWTDGGSRGDLRAVFTPTGEGKWDVAFHFEFNGSPYTYSGTARGTLADGPLEGRVRNQQKNRSFTFRGTFTSGEFQGTHAEATGSGEHATGSLTLTESSRPAVERPGSPHR